MKKPVRILFTILCVVFIAVFLFSGYKIYQTVFAPGGYYQSNKNAKEVQNTYVKPAEATAVPVTPTDAPAEEAAPAENQVVLDDEVSPINVDFASLKERNGDACAWIYCPDTVINYVVVQTEDNMFYLHKDIDSNYSSYGTLFVECMNQKGFKDTNNIIYGHHMNDGKMFAKLIDYSKQETYNQHPVFYLNTPDQNYRIELFSAYVTDMNSDTYKISFATAEENQAWLDSIISQSAIESNVSVKPGDQILTLSTCTYEYDDARFVVHGKMIPIH
ncbi:MAG: class B sortase [Oscillospiraceae bacterium]|nr:class B sortase [Oscillospiraceae bacterium]